MEKNVTYNSQGDAIYSNATTTYPTTTYPTTTTTNSATYHVPSTNQSVASAGTVADNPSLYDNTAKGKMLRFYNKVETSMRKKWDSSSGPSSRTDPLGGYTVKGPGYYEKKHKFTRRVTTRGTPPASALPSSSSSYSSSYSSSTPSSYSSSTPSYSSSSYQSSSSIPSSSVPSYSTPSAPETLETRAPPSYNSPSVPVH